MRELDRIIEDVSSDAIDMNYMECFKDNLQSIKNRIDKIDVEEYKQIYANNISLGEEVVKLFSAVKKDYKEKTENIIKDYRQNELRCRDKESQNIDLESEMRDLRKRIKKEHDYKKKFDLQKALKQRELLISINKKGNKISTDHFKASLLARYDLYKELADQVNDSFNPSDSKTNEEKLKKLVQLLETAIGATCYGSVLTIKAIIKAFAEFINSYDYSQIEDDRIHCINAEYQLQRKKYVDYVVAYLAIKMYLGDWDFIERFCYDKVEALNSVVMK